MEFIEEGITPEFDYVELDLGQDVVNAAMAGNFLEIAKSYKTLLDSFNGKEISQEAEEKADQTIEDNTRLITETLGYRANVTCCHQTMACVLFGLDYKSIPDWREKAHKALNDIGQPEGLNK